MMTQRPACIATHAMPQGTVYEHTLRVQALVQATMTLVLHHTSIIDEIDSPAAPVSTLLEMAVDELNSLSGRVSD